MKNSKMFLCAAFAALFLSACCERQTALAAMPSALDVIDTRTSIRSYLPTPVAADTVDLLLHAAMAAPSARNAQPWTFVVVDDKALLLEMADSLPYAKMLKQAPLAIVVCGTLPEEGEKPWWVQDCSAASENLLLAAHAMGLGAVWTGVYPGTDRVRTVRNLLNIPEKLVPLNIIPIGYPAETPEPKQKWNPAKVQKNAFER